jgi:transposase
VKLMPPAYVKAYVKRNKNDAADAAAICEAVTRPSMRFVPVKNAEQQSVLMLHRAHSRLVRQRTMLVNALRAHMAEFGIVAPQGLRHVGILTKTIVHQQQRLPELARSILLTIVDQLNGTMARIREIERLLTKWHRQSRVSRLLATVPGVGIMGASAIAATVADPSLFRSGREFAAWLGMTPRQNSSGGKERLGRTSKRGDKYIRSLLTAGAVAVLRHARNRPTDPRWRVGSSAAGAQTDQTCCGRTSQQDRPHRLGGDDARGGLPAEGSFRAAGIATDRSFGMRG